MQNVLKFQKNDLLLEKRKKLTFYYGPLFYTLMHTVQLSLWFHQSLRSPLLIQTGSYDYMMSQLVIMQVSCTQH